MCELKSIFLLSCDWGTSRCRLRLVKVENGKIIDGIESDQGVQIIASRAKNDEERAGLFNAELTDMIRTLQKSASRSLAGVPIVLSGMVGSTIGWKMVPYANLPVNLNGDKLRIDDLEPVILAENAMPNPVMLISGLATTHDILRGEETEIIGILQDPEYQDFRQASVLILPGTHSKHVVIQENEIVDFQSHITGELLSILSKNSVLRHSLPAEHVEIIPDALRAGIDSSQEDSITHILFSIRARQVLYDTSPEKNWSFLLGVLIGIELSGLKKMSDDYPILLCAGEGHRQSYSLALEYMGMGDRATIVSSDAMRTAVVNCHRLVITGRGVI